MNLTELKDFFTASGVSVVSVTGIAFLLLIVTQGLKQLDSRMVGWRTQVIVMGLAAALSLLYVGAKGPALTTFNGWLAFAVLFLTSAAAAMIGKDFIKKTTNP